jgi:hypothetical protein
MNRETGWNRKSNAKEHRPIQDALSPSVIG